LKGPLLTTMRIIEVKNTFLAVENSSFWLVQGKG